MQANRSRDTAPEIAVRRILHADGYRYRVHFQPEPTLRRKADIVFTRQRIAIFIDGCFWHGCPEHGRRDFNHNVDYWPSKIAGNRARDVETTEVLKKAGWQVLRFWEHESPSTISTLIRQTLTAPTR